MKAKNLSKVLAFLVAAVMIFSALPLMAFATDEATTYTVSFGAPAIPMDVDTKVDLKTLNVEMVKGETAVSGADITWAAAAQDGLTLDAAKKTVEVTAVGNYKLTATVGETTKNVWVIAKPADQEKIYLVNIPSVRATINGDKWRIFGNYNGTELTVADALSSNYLIKSPTSSDIEYVQMQHAIGDKKANGSSANVGATLVYVDEIFKDFSDYTVESYCTAKGLTNSNSPGAGVGGRVVLNDAETAYTTAVLSYIRNNEQVSFCRPYDFNPAKPSWGNWGGFGTSSGSNTLWADTTDRFYTVKTVLADSAIMVYLNRGAGAGDEAKLTSTSDHPYANQAVTAGYPCLTGFYQPTRFANFYVYLNSNDMPAPMTGDETDEPEAPTVDITIVGEGTANVDAVVGSENTYTVTLDPADGYKLKVGSLVINGDIAHGYDDTGCVYTFTTNDLANTTIAVEYIADNGQFNTAMLGATIPTNPEVKGIRFGARTDSIMRSAVDATKGLLNDTINVGGVECAITEIGMILFPTAPLGDAELTVATDGVVRQPVTKIVGLTNGYADIAITLIDIPNDMANVQITSRMYVAYTDANDVTQYVYSNAISKSYSDVATSIAQ